ncbi:MAG: hypothetical protein KGL43_06175 [Burkholderiales bacterium]|nr:hypothetical protein [Burkholderiales bacterium]MDE2397155.1 hypothetical protein [Burkholderiales bacterium]MDE2453161.1 hypothetical protein [Burkholderiales bacterium]
MVRTLASPPSPVSAAAQRNEALRAALLSTVELLAQRRACEIDTGLIDDYVAINWLEWVGGSLKLTVTGNNVCKQLTVRQG